VGRYKLGENKINSKNAQVKRRWGSTVSRESWTLLGKTFGGETGRERTSGFFIIGKLTASGKEDDPRFKKERMGLKDVGGRSEGVFHCCWRGREGGKGSQEKGQRAGVQKMSPRWCPRW